MQLIGMRCPACGAAIDQKRSGRFVTCEYCGSRFMLDDAEAGAFVEDDGDSFEDEPQDSSSMASYAAKECEDFLANFGHDDTFESSQKILNGLGISGGDDVYLIHDDTLFKSGKNGFAITESGIYCRELWEDTVYYDWTRFARLAEPTAGDGCIKCGEDVVCYFTCDANVLPAIVRLYQKLYKHAQHNA